MVETKTLTLTVAEVVPPVGEAEFIFAAFNPPIDTREVFAVTSSWPARSKTYETGDPVRIQYCVKNIGTGAGRWTIVVKDADTGTTLQTWYGDLDPGYRFKTASGVGVLVGPMPNKDWNLSITVTP